MYKMDLQKRQRNQSSKYQNSWDHGESRRFQKKIYFCFTDYAKAFDCADHNNLKNSLKCGSPRPPYLLPEKSVYGSKENRRDMEQQTGSKLGKKHDKAVYCLPA